VTPQEISACTAGVKTAPAEAKARPVSMPMPGKPPVKIICLSYRPDSGDLPELAAAFAET